jgi:hypothetical protein
MFQDLMLAEAGHRLEVSKELAETLQKIEHDLSHDPTDDFDGLIKAATRLPDGTAVFKSQGAARRFNLHVENSLSVSG